MLELVKDIKTWVSEHQSFQDTRPHTDLSKVEGSLANRLESMIPAMGGKTLDQLVNEFEAILNDENVSISEELKTKYLGEAKTRKHAASLMSYVTNLYLSGSRMPADVSRYDEAMVANWKLATTIPAGMSLPAMISKLQELSDGGVKVVKFREEPNGTVGVWSQHGSDIDDTDLDELPFEFEEEPGADLGPEDTSAEFTETPGEYENQHPTEEPLITEGNKVMSFEDFNK